jgi:putative ABC transport system ATP-binding protein
MGILEVRNLSKVYGNRILFSALDQVSFSIEQGEFVGIMGPSGSGKTTLLNMISTVDKPTSGEIRIRDKNPLKLKGEELALFRRRELGFVFQDYNLLDTLTVGENIVLPLVLDGVAVKTQDEECNRISKVLGIEDLVHKRTFEISGGQSQRTAIARALVHKPTLLLADEPTGNLDSKSAKTVMELFEKINQEEKVTTIMVTHDALSASYCSRILFIKDGTIYNELYRGDSRPQFYQEIIDVLALLGGGSK